MEKLGGGGRNTFVRVVYGETGGFRKLIFRIHKEPLSLANKIRLAVDSHFSEGMKIHISNSYTIQVKILKF